MSDIYLVEVERNDKIIGADNKVYRVESKEDALYELEDYARNANVSKMFIYHMVDNVPRLIYRLEIF